MNTTCSSICNLQATLQVLYEDEDEQMLYIDEQVLYVDEQVLYIDEDEEVLTFLL